MHSGLMQRLRRGLLLALLGAALPATAATEASVADESQREEKGGEAANDKLSLGSAEHERYLAELQRLYPRRAPRQALLEHCNRLLESYALRSGFRVGQAQRDDLLYQLSVARSGVLNVREETRSADGSRMAVRNQQVELFGADPFIRYQCPNRGPSCQVLNPQDGTPLLTLVRDHTGVAELAKALTFLVRDLQKG